MERMYIRPTVQMRHPSQLYPHPRNTEFFDDIDGAKWDEFVSSIDEDGIWNPIISDMDGMIISGTQRWRAARQLGFSEIPVIERYYEDDDAKLLELIKSNTQQRFSGNNEIKTARCIREIRRICGVNQGDAAKKETPRNNCGGSVDSEEEGPPAIIAGGPVPPTTKELAKMCGIKERQLQNMMKLLKLAPELQDAVEEGEISATVASTILSKLSQDTQKELISNMGINALKDMTAKELGEIIPQIKEYETQNQELSGKVAELEAALEAQPGEVFSENELSEAQAKIEKLEADKRQYYEKLQFERSSHNNRLKELNEQYEREKRKTVELSEHLATLSRMKKDVAAFGKLDLEILREMISPILEVREALDDLTEQIG